MPDALSVAPGTPPPCRSAPRADPQPESFALVPAELLAHRLGNCRRRHAQEGIANQLRWHSLVRIDSHQRCRLALLGSEYGGVAVAGKAGGQSVVEHQDLALQVGGKLQVLPRAHADRLRLHVARLGEGLREGGQRLRSARAKQRQLCGLVLPGGARVVLHLDLRPAPLEVLDHVLDRTLVRRRAAQPGTDLLAQK